MNIGDKVQHATGGPVMFIYSINYRPDGTTQLYYCRWWDNTRAEFRTEAFLGGELVGEAGR